MTVLENARRQTEVRLAEARQPYGSPAKQALSELVFAATYGWWWSAGWCFTHVSVLPTRVDRRNGPGGRGLGLPEVQPRAPRAAAWEGYVGVLGGIAMLLALRLLVTFLTSQAVATWADR